MQSITSLSPAGNPPQAAHGMTEFLAYHLGGEEYGIDIQKVQELRGYDAVTAIANGPAFLKGVVNLRGIIVSTVDMRIMLPEDLFFKS